MSDAILAEIRAQLRPSNLARLAACPGSALAVALMALAGYRARDNALADKGTAMHAATARGIQRLVIRWEEEQAAAEARGEACDGMPSAEAWPESAAPMRNDAGLTAWLLSTPGVDREDLWAIRASLVVAGKLIRKYGVQPEHVLVEHHLDDCGLNLPNGGTADLILVLPFKVLVIVDWKYGYNEVEHAELNDQAAAYAVMGAATFQTEVVHVYIHLPRAEEIKLHRAAYGVVELKDRSDYTRTVTDGAANPNAPRRASLDACRYCPALGRCPEARALVEKAMADYATFGPTTTTEWGNVLTVSKLAEKWAEAVKEDLKELRAKDPAFIPTGFIVTKPQTLRNVPDFPALYSNAIAAGVGATVLELAKGLSVAALEEAEVPLTVYQDLMVVAQRDGYLKAAKAVSA